MIVDYNGFHFEGSLDELKMTYSLLTGMKLNESATATETAETKPVVKKRQTRERSKVVMFVKSSTGIATTMLFNSQKEAALFLNKPDASSISFSISKHKWTKGNRSVDAGKLYKFIRLADAKLLKRIDQIALAKAEQLCSKTNPIVHI